MGELSFHAFFQRVERDGRPDLNPYVLNRNPCESSSGSAVAAAGDLTTVTVGTETNGSIVCPAYSNGDVGLKPTLDLVSRTDVVPISARTPPGLSPAT